MTLFWRNSFSLLLETGKRHFATNHAGVVFESDEPIKIKDDFVLEQADKIKPAE